MTIITTDANDLVRELHDRMPVVIGVDDRDRWLNGDDPGELQELLKLYPAELMTDHVACLHAGELAQERRAQPP